jgi:hypothetical protein
MGSKTVLDMMWEEMLVAAPRHSVRVRFTAEF